MMEYKRHQQFMLLVTVFMIILLQIVQSSLMIMEGVVFQFGGQDGMEIYNNYIQNDFRAAEPMDGR